MLELAAGGRIGPYQILSLLGKGGMGEVYLAEDTRLDRKVALKVLPRQLSYDQDRLRRFTQEARAASALNHPGILTVFDIGEIEGLHYIATEFVDGQTLRDKTRANRLSLKETLEIAIQVASALAAAHEAGIVHRDIKPENVMIRKDGYTKILDFGLAKLTEAAPQGAGDTQAMTQAFETRAGVVMGTAAYMSPEQARGKAVDARSDLFSLGVMLYEMVAHRPPFEGETVSHLIVAILERQQPPLAAFSPEAPPELERIVAKALAKDPDERYQTARDFGVDLKQFRKALELGESGYLRTTPGSGYPVGLQHSGAMPSSFGIPQPGSNPSLYGPTGSNPPGSNPPGQPISGPHGPVPHGGHPSNPPASAYVAGAAIGAGMAGAYGSSPGSSPGYNPPPPNPGSNPGASPSPYLFGNQPPSGGAAVAAGAPPADTGWGKDLRSFGAWFRRIPRKRKVTFLVILLSLWGLRFGTRNDPSRRPVKQVHSFDSFDVSRVTTTGKVSSAAISPDGKYILYLQLAGNAQALWMRQSDTGSNVQIVPPKEGVFYGGLSFSPDGDYVYFVKGQVGVPQAIYSMPVLGGEPKLVAEAVNSGAALSPNGKKMAYLKRSGPGAPRELFISNLDGTELRSVFVEPEKTIIRGFAWAPDNQRVALSMTELGGDLQSEIYLLNTKSGRRKKATSMKWAFTGELAFFNSENHIVLLASERFNVLNNQVWHVDVDSGEARRITNDLNHYMGLSVAPKADRILLVQSEARMGLAVAPASSPDALKEITAVGPQADGLLGVAWMGKNELVYHSRASGADELWTTSIEGATGPRQITRDMKLTFLPNVSPDGNSIFALSVRGGQPLVWRMNRDGGEARQVTTQIAADTRPSISADGKYVLVGSLGQTKPGLWREPAEGGGKPEQIWDQVCLFPAYSPDGKRIYCWQPSSTAQKLPRIVFLPASGGTPEKIVDISLTGANDPQWLPDSSGVSLLGAVAGYSQLFTFKLGEDTPKQITHFAGKRVYRHAWSPDGTQIAYSTGDFVLDAVLLTNRDADHKHNE
jgi:serine/threonine protein kinase/Tol biopolymer transport system component